MDASEDVKLFLGSVQDEAADKKKDLGTESKDESILDASAQDEQLKIAIGHAHTGNGKPKEDLSDANESQMIDHIPQTMTDPKRKNANQMTNGPGSCSILSDWDNLDG